MRRRYLKNGREGSALAAGSFTVNERERLRRDDLSCSDAGGDMFATISAGYVVCVMAIVLYAKLGALIPREMR
jgi:hypothetical protein